MKGILFREWKVRAIAANPDKEWQTRRTIKPQPERGVIAKCPGDDISFSNFEMYLDVHKTGGWIPIGKVIKSRYHAGEVIYIKETVIVFDNGFDWVAKYTNNQEKIVYPPNGFISKHAIDGEGEYSARTMPAWAARYFIKILDVQACRTRDISFEDCLAEGIVDESAVFRVPSYTWPNSKAWYDTPQEAYFALYDSINGKGAHERNFDWKYPLKLVSCSP